MRAETAAAYVGEPSGEAFLRKIARSTLPRAKRRGAQRKWDRLDLDMATGTIPTDGTYFDAASVLWRGAS